MTLSEGPYAAAATTYFERGVGSPLPLPPRKKKTPPDDYTGYEGLWPSYADVHTWATNGKGIGNVCLRLVETVIGIDVDAYGEKHGDVELAKLEAELGALPATFVSTSRALPSGIRFFRVPAGRRWADVAGPGIEIIHWGHRYAVVAPSIHPDTGDVYRWVRDGVVVPGPSLDDLPLLPPAWVAYLDRGDIAERSTKASVTTSDAFELLSGYPVGEPCPWLSRVLSDATHELSGAASRHDTVRRLIGVVVRAGEQGHVGSVVALGHLEELWLDAMSRGESRQPDHGEYARMVEGAVALVLDSPTAPEDRGCCGSAAGDLSGLDFDPGEVASGFWDTRPILSHIRLYAQAQRVSAWAVLGVVLTRCVVRVRHEIVLPDLIGSYGSLNLFVALVGPSGMGKGAAERAAKQAVDFRQRITTASIGSGEGICHLYAHREVKDKVSTVVRHENAVLFSVPEVDTLGALGARQGATLLPELRKAWSGEQLGMAYADPTKRLPIDEYTYRMGLILGVQPLRAGDLLADTGGTPQRFVWLPCVDRHPPDVKPPKPAPWVWEPPADPIMWNTHVPSLAEMTVPEVARQAVDATRLAALKDEGDPLDGHKLQCQLKVAAALALLDSRYEVNDEDWSLAEIVMLVSSRVRDSIQAELRKVATESSEARAHVRGREAVIVAEVTESAVAGRCRDKVLKILAGSKDWTPFRELRNGVSRAQREHLEPALAELVREKVLEVDDGGDRHHYRPRKQGV